MLYFSFRESSRHKHKCPLGHEVKVSMTYISQSSDFVLYFEDYLIYEHHTLGLWVSMSQQLTSN